ncbi:cleavage stimulation factor, 3' pre-RNA, subunit 1 [Phlyctochytrium planicorne]|nr:cleavage stimulation factor, 3' pre-RNA, subunit 1 [Phlyctochytrium planicorne]
MDEDPEDDEDDLNLDTVGRSADTSLKVLDVNKIRDAHFGGSSGDPAEKPVIRTLYDHVLPVNDVAFHPNGTVLASCSDDMNVKLYDLQKPNVKRSFRYLQDAAPIRSIAFHPSGDFLITGTDQDLIRMFDIQTFKCFTPNMPAEDLRGPINMVRFAPKANFFAVAAADGTIRLHDTVSGRLINAIRQAHGGAPVSSVQFSKNGRYMLSAGLDSVPKLWELSTGKLVKSYQGASQSVSIRATFAGRGDEFVISSDDSTYQIICWDTRTGHQKTVRGIAASPIDGAFVSFSDDSRARYWGIDK